MPRRKNQDSVSRPAGYHYCMACGLAERKAGLPQNSTSWFKYTCPVHGMDVLSRAPHDTATLCPSQDTIASNKGRNK